ncbi:MAG: hypothetical protein OXC62_09225 [Aestuariivita sp.]|nr:hypothetical protein [Aestuariivita sp.]
MAYNLFIAYDLINPGQNYEQVKDRIKELGQYYHFQLSLFYVHTTFTPGDAWNHISKALDANDRLAVINAASGIVSNWDYPPVDAINAIWNTP